MPPHATQNLAENTNDHVAVGLRDGGDGYGGGGLPNHAEIGLTDVGGPPNLVVVGVGGSERGWYTLYLWFTTAAS